MQLTIIHKENSSDIASNGGLIKFALSSKSIADIILYSISDNPLLKGNINRILLPKQWDSKSQKSLDMVSHYKKDIPVDLATKGRREPWSIVSNGRFYTQICNELLQEVLTITQADIVMINTVPEFLAYRERVLVTSENQVAGFRRHYDDFVENTNIPNNWPHHILIKDCSFNMVLNDSKLPFSFEDFICRCNSSRLKLAAFNIAGSVIDLGTKDGLLCLCKTILKSCDKDKTGALTKAYSGNNNEISASARLIGKVMLGDNVRIGPNAIIIGPALIGDNTRIGKGAMILSSIIGPNISVPQKQILQDEVLKKTPSNWNTFTQKNKSMHRPLAFQKQLHEKQIFRHWSRFSYAKFFKRIADIIFASIVLILFAPVLPFIALAIKLNPPGTVFFTHKRQGLHGKIFSCLKFRTMSIGADDIQQKLRLINETDGPQFKIDDDPRVTTVGMFLRDTCIDEIPQFFNVLAGHMSVVGPRPSPISENVLCPSWRDARLSVRPGITGLWQVCRTREPMKDFQEWIYFDTKYVRELSLKKDVWICWETFKYISREFLKKF